jgi:hypothetical protein
VTRGSPDPVSLIAIWDEAEAVWLIDAVVSGAAAFPLGGRPTSEVRAGARGAAHAVRAEVTAALVGA